MIKVNKRYDDYQLRTELSHQQKDLKNNLNITERENNVKLRAIKVVERIIKNSIKNKTLDPEYIQTQEQFKDE